LQFPLPVEVKTNLTKPVVSSEAVGEYVAFKSVLLGVKVPEPLDQMPVVVGPDTTPERTDDALFLQDDRSVPAFTSGADV
jgi:hypothetical protein